MEHGSGNKHSHKRQDANRTKPHDNEGRHAESKRDHNGRQRTESQDAQRQGTDHRTKQSGNKQGTTHSGGHHQRRRSDKRSSAPSKEQRNGEQPHGSRPDNGTASPRGDGEDRRQRPNYGNKSKPSVATGSSDLPGTDRSADREPRTNDLGPGRRRRRNNQNRGYTPVGDISKRADVQQPVKRTEIDGESAEHKSSAGPTPAVAEVEITMTDSSSEASAASTPTEPTAAETSSDETAPTQSEITKAPEVEVAGPPKPIAEVDEESALRESVAESAHAVSEVTVGELSPAAETASPSTDATNAESTPDQAAHADSEIEVPDDCTTTPAGPVAEVAEPAEDVATSVPSSETATVAPSTEETTPSATSQDVSEIASDAEEDNANPAEGAGDAPATVRVEDSSPVAEGETSKPAQKPTAVSPASSEASEKLTLDTVESFSDLLRYIEELDGDLRPFEMRRSSPARIAVAKSIDLTPFQDRIAAVASRDTKLATALALLLTTEKSELSGTARKNITELAARILTQHPAFIGDEPLQDRVAQLRTETVDTETLSQTVVRVENLVGRPFDGRESMKAPALQALQDNAVHIVVLLAGSAAQWDLPQYIDALADEVWDAVTVQSGTTADREKLATIPKSTRRAAAVIVGSARERIRAVESERDSALARVDIAHAENARLIGELEAARLRVEDLETELSGVRAALDEEVNARRSERMSSTNSFEILRVDTAKLIADQIEVLEDALDALKHGHTQVTDEFVSRSVIKFRKGLNALQPDAVEDK